MRCLGLLTAFSLRGVDSRLIVLLHGDGLEKDLGSFDPG